MPTHGTEGGADRRARAGVLTAVLSTVVASLFVTVAASQPAAAAPSSPSRFVPVAPCRLLDTRLSGGPIAAGGTVDVAGGLRCSAMSRRAPTPPRSRSPPPPGGGRLRDRLAHRVDQARGLAAQLPHRRDGGQLPSCCRSAPAAGCRCSRSPPATWWSTSRATSSRRAGAVTSGRFVPVETHRLIDTVASGRPAAGTAVHIGMAAMPEVPAGSQAVAVNITTTQSLGAGILHGVCRRTSRFPMPRCSTPTVPTRPGRRRRSCRSAPKVSTSTPRVATTSSSTSSATSPDRQPSSSTAGRFVSNVPTRLVDTRLAAGAGGGPRLWDDGSREFAGQRHHRRSGGGRERQRHDHPDRGSGLRHGRRRLGHHDHSRRA